MADISFPAACSSRDFFFGILRITGDYAARSNTVIPGRLQYCVMLPNILSGPEAINRGRRGDLERRGMVVLTNFSLSVKRLRRIYPYRQERATFPRLDPPEHRQRKSGCIGHAGWPPGPPLRDTTVVTGQQKSGLSAASCTIGYPTSLTRTDAAARWSPRGPDRWR